LSLCDHITSPLSTSQVNSIKVPMLYQGGISYYSN